MQASIHSALALALLVMTCSVAAQDPSAGRFGHAAGCVRENSSRLPGTLNCGERPQETVTITHESERTATLAMPEIVVADCQAEISFEYSQRGASARMQGTIDNEYCAASAGSFVVSIRIRNDQGEAITEEHDETWQRTDAEPLSFSKDYAIGENVDLVRIRTLKSICKCTVAAE